MQEAISFCKNRHGVSCVSRPYLRLRRLRPMSASILVLFYSGSDCIQRDGQVCEGSGT